MEYYLITPTRVPCLRFIWACWAFILMVNVNNITFSKKNKYNLKSILNPQFVGNSLFCLFFLILYNTNNICRISLRFSKID